MPLLPPDLAKPFPNDPDRDAARRLLEQRDRLLAKFERLARTPADQWSPADIDRFPTTTNGVPDPPQARVARWAAIFADELATIHAVAGGRPLSDIELRQALYLAGRLLATVTGRPLNNVDHFQNT